MPTNSFLSVVPKLLKIIIHGSHSFATPVTCIYSNICMKISHFTSNRNEYQESSWGKRRPVCKSDNLTAICELTV
jgi:hypothetical protein